MAKRIRSAIKKHRQSLKRRARNTQVRSALKTITKELHTAIEEKDFAKSQEFLKATVSELDKAASKGIIHKRTASRTIGRLSKRVQALGETTPQQPS